MTRVASPAGSPALTGARQAADRAFAYVTALFTVGVVAQVFLAGRGVFGLDTTDVEQAASFDAHRALGNALGVVAVVALLLALGARRSRGTVIGAAALALLTEAAQHALAQAGSHHAWVGGLHAADGVLILVLAAWLAFSTWPRPAKDPR